MEKIRIDILPNLYLKEDGTLSIWELMKTKKRLQLLEILN